MHKHIVSHFGRLLFTITLSLAPACGSVAPSPSQGTNADEAFSVRATATEVVSGGHTTLSAVDSGGNPVAVTWAPPSGRGVVDASNVYTAPIVFGDEDVAIVAARVDHPEVTATVSVHVLNALPVMKTSGGAVLASPVFTSISFADDADAAIADTVVSKIVTGSYWASVTQEYGVGPATATGPVHLTDKAPATITDDAIGAWLANMLDGTHPEFPAPKEGSAYLISYPPTTAITFKGNQSCQYFSAYHSETKVAGKSVPYVVGAHCVANPAGDFEYAISEDLIEAALDPFRFTAPAFALTDSAHLVWNFIREGEAAGLCQVRKHGTAATPSPGFVAPLIWSNSAAAAGHEPCVPATSHEFVTALPILEEDVPISFPPTYGTPSGLNGLTKGIRIPVGTTRTIDVAIYSDGPADKVHTFTFRTFPGGADGPFFKADLSPTSGKNGDHLTLTLQTLYTDPDLGGVPFLLEAEDGSRSIGYVRTASP